MSQTFFPNLSLLQWVGRLSRYVAFQEPPTWKESENVSTTRARAGQIPMTEGTVGTGSVGATGAEDRPPPVTSSLPWAGSHLSCPAQRGDPWHEAAVRV